MEDVTNEIIDLQTGKYSNTQAVRSVKLQFWFIVVAKMAHLIIRFPPEDIPPPETYPKYHKPR